MSVIDQFKKGIHTSEFWLTILAAVWLVVKTSVDPSKSWSQNVTTMAPLLGAAVYAALRTWLKRKRAGTLDVAMERGLVMPEIPPVDATATGDDDAQDTAAPTTPAS